MSKKQMSAAAILIFRNIGFYFVECRFLSGGEVHLFPGGTGDVLLRRSSDSLPDNVVQKYATSGIVR